MLGLARARLTHVADFFRELGLRRGLTVFPVWLLARREFVAVAWDIPPRQEPASEPPDVRWTVLDEAGLPAFTAECRELTAREVRQRWASGLDCLVLWRGSAMVAYRWDVPSAVGALYLPYLGRTLRLGPGEALTYETRTVPASRRLRLGAMLVAAAMDRARQRGDRRYVGFVASWNRASVQWAEGLGWERVGTVGWERAGLRRRYFATGAMSIVGDEVRFPPSRMAVDRSHRAPPF